MNALPSPGEREDFYTRCNRLGRSGEWMRKHWPQLEDACRQHMDGELTDERLELACQCADEGRNPPPLVTGGSKPKTDAQILAAWAHNDRLAEEMQANPAAYCCAAVLIPAFKRFRERRYAERPDLAARYYGENAA